MAEHILMPKRLGEWLVELGWLESREIEAALSMQPTSGRPLGENLVQRGLLSEHELKALLFLHQAERLSERPQPGQQRRLGEILLAAGRLDHAQIHDALNAHRQSGVPLGQVLMDRGVVTELELRALLAWQEQDARRPVRALLGEILVSMGLIRASDLEQALHQQRRTSQPLGTILVQMGKTTREAVQQALRIQSRWVTASLAAVMLAGTLGGCGLQTPTVPAQSETGAILRYNGGRNVEYRTVSSSPSKGITRFTNGAQLIEDVPFFEQNVADNTCAQAAMAMVLNYWDKRVSYQTAVWESNRFNLPTSADTLSGYLERKGLQASPFRQGKLSTLRRLVGEGRPPIVLLDFSMGSQIFAHYVVIIGFNEAQKEIIMHDSIDGPYVQMREDEFLRRWKNGPMVGLPVVGGPNYENLVIDIQG